MQKPATKSARAETNPARTSGALATTEMARNTPEAYPSEPATAGVPKPLSPSARDAIGGAFKAAPAAVPTQNSFAESEAGPAAIQGGTLNVLVGNQKASIRGFGSTHSQWRVTPDGHLERSTTPGAWTRELTDHPVKFHAVSVAGDDVWAGGSGGALFHSSDDGQDWSREPLGTPPNVETGTIVSIQFGDAQHGVVLTGGGSRWTTSDGGASWTKE